MYKLAFLLSTLFCCMIPTQVLATALCTNDTGSVTGWMAIDMPNDLPISAVDDGRYPSKINSVQAEIKSTLNGQNPDWRLKCTGEAWAYPDLYTHLNPHPEFNASNGWPYLQATTANYLGKYYYGVETFYDSPAGERLYWTGSTGHTLRGQPLKIGVGATPEHPVYVTLKDLGVDKVTMLGYQAANGRSDSFQWGFGGTVHFLRFFVRNIDTDADQFIRQVSDFRLNLRQVVMTKKTCGLGWNSRQHIVDFGSLTQKDFSGDAVGAFSNISKMTDFYLRCISGTTLTYRFTAATSPESTSLVLLKKFDGEPYVGYGILLRSRYGNEPFRAISSLTGGNAQPPAMTMVGDYDSLSGRSSDLIQVQSQLVRTLPAGSGSSGPFTATAMIEVNYQ